MRLARSAELWRVGEIGAGEGVGPAEECRSVALGGEGRLGDERCWLGTVTHSPGTSLTARRGVGGEAFGGAGLSACVFAGCGACLVAG